jgi:hypothetical protein
MDPARATGLPSDFQDATVGARPPVCFSRRDNRHNDGALRHPSPPGVAKFVVPSKRMRRDPLRPAYAPGRIRRVLLLAFRDVRGNEAYADRSRRGDALPVEGETTEITDREYDAYGARGSDVDGFNANVQSGAAYR